jgi:hypothetical protein
MAEDSVERPGKNYQRKVWMDALHQARLEANAGSVLYNDELGAMVETICLAVQCAVLADKPTLLRKIYRTARDVLKDNHEIVAASDWPHGDGPDPLKELLALDPGGRFVEWKHFESATMKLARERAAAGASRLEMSALLTRCMLGAPVPKVAEVSNVDKAIGESMGGATWIDQYGRVLNDNRILVKAFAATMRAVGIDSKMRKDPNRSTKDRLGLRDSHKTKKGKLA